MSAIPPVNVSEAQLETLREIARSGAALGEGLRGSVELLGYTSGMSNPLARISAGARPLNTVSAVARFVWLVSGSDRLEDIAYYEAKARKFTDDHLSIPGSSYGKRIFNAAPGTNQMQGVVNELRSNPDSRRAAAVVWLPEDAVRQSHDIPCTFGLFFHIRAGELTMTTVMRSNNAVILLPYNFFEFSLLGELVAAELNVPFTRYVHWAASMHTVNMFDAERDALLAAGDTTALTMPEMPRGDALAAAASLARFEAALRHAATPSAIGEIAMTARAVLDEYWVGFFNVLYVFGLAKRQLRDEVAAERATIPAHFRSGVDKSIDDALGEVVLAPDDDGALFSVLTLNGVSDAERVAVAASQVSDADWLLPALQALSTAEAPITVDEVIAIQGHLRQRDMTLAARNAGAPSALTPADLAEALLNVRENKRR